MMHAWHHNGDACHGNGHVSTDEMIHGTGMG
jgi:hypothetical protein